MGMYAISDTGVIARKVYETTEVEIYKKIKDIDKKKKTKITYPPQKELLESAGKEKELVTSFIVDDFGSDEPVSYAKTVLTKIKKKGFTVDSVLTLDDGIYALSFVISDFEDGMSIDSYLAVFNEEKDDFDLIEDENQLTGHEFIDSIYKAVTSAVTKLIDDLR